MPSFAGVMPNRASPDVAGQRDLAAAADAETGDRGDRGFVQLGDGAFAVVHRLAVVGGAFRAAAQGRELGDVGAGGEVLATPDHEHPHVLICGNLSQEPWYGRPHLVRHGVALGRAVDRQRGDRTGRGQLQELAHPAHDTYRLLAARAVSDG
jgi:hypothetical protein